MVRELSHDLWARGEPRRHVASVQGEGWRGGGGGGGGGDSEASVHLSLKLVQQLRHSADLGLVLGARTLAFLGRADFSPLDFG